MSQNDENTDCYPEPICQHCRDPEQTAIKIDLNHPDNNIFRKNMEIFCSKMLYNVSLPEFLCALCMEFVNMLFDYSEMCVKNHTTYSNNLLSKRPLGHILRCECTRCGGIFTLEDENEECRKCKSCKMELIQEGMDFPLMTLKKVTRGNGKKKDGRKEDRQKEDRQKENRQKEDGQKEDRQKEDGQKDPFVQPKAKVAKKVDAAEPVSPSRSERSVCSSITVGNVPTVIDIDCNGDKIDEIQESIDLPLMTLKKVAKKNSQKEDRQKEDSQKDTFVQPKARAKVAKKVAAAEPVLPRRSPRTVCSSMTVENVRNIDDMDCNSGSRKRSRSPSSAASSIATSSSRRARKAITTATTGRKIV